jgi:uncharacterized protein YcbK (DUF882 family)
MGWTQCVVIVFLCLLALPTTATTVSTPSEVPVYRLHFYHIHTRERLDIIYRHGGIYDPDAQARVNQYLRDYRTGDIHEYDRNLLDLLHDLMSSLRRPDGEIEVLCGYRTPKTNEYLRNSGHAVARHSLHMQAMAIDIRVEGVSASRVRDAALALHRGGVGHYPSSGFVHIDVGRVQRWSSSE